MVKSLDDCPSSFLAVCLALAANMRLLSPSLMVCGLVCCLDAWYTRTCDQHDDCEPKMLYGLVRGRAAELRARCLLPAPMAACFSVIRRRRLGEVLAGHDAARTKCWRSRQLAACSLHFLLLNSAE